MSIKNGDKPAMPTKGRVGVVKGAITPFQTNDKDIMQFTGLTKREEFAKAAMAALLSKIESIEDYNESKIKRLVSNSVKIAEMQLAELERTQKY